jgi:hypothetical protein
VDHSVLRAHVVRRLRRAVTRQPASNPRRRPPTLCGRPLGPTLDRAIAPWFECRPRAALAAAARVRDRMGSDA